MEIVIYIFFVVVAFILFNDYDDVKTQRLKKYFPVVLFVWLIFFIIMCTYNSPNLGDEKEYEIYLSIKFSFVIYNLFFLAYTRIFAKNNHWFLLLFVPMTFLFVINILSFNKPGSHGGLGGFASAFNEFFKREIYITYPIFIFSFSIIKFNDKVKGVLIILISIITGIIGINQTIGIEGYLGDSSGEIFLFAIFLLFMIGVFHLFKKIIIRKLK